MIFITTIYFSHSLTDQGDKIIVKEKYQETRDKRKRDREGVKEEWLGKGGERKGRKTWGELKGQSNEIFDPQFYSSFEPAWATDQCIQMFSILISFSKSYLILVSKKLTPRSIILREETPSNLVAWLRAVWYCAEKFENLSKNETKNESILNHWSLAQAGPNDEKYWGSKISLDRPFKRWEKGKGEKERKKGMGEVEWECM